MSQPQRAPQPRQVFPPRKQHCRSPAKPVLSVREEKHVRTLQGRSRGSLSYRNRQLSLGSSRSTRVLLPGLEGPQGADFSPAPHLIAGEGKGHARSHTSPAWFTHCLPSQHFKVTLQGWGRQAAHEGRGYNTPEDTKGIVSWSPRTAFPSSSRGRRGLQGKHGRF